MRPGRSPRRIFQGGSATVGDRASNAAQNRFPHGGIPPTSVSIRARGSCTGALVNSSINLPMSGTSAKVAALASGAAASHLRNGNERFGAGSLDSRAVPRLASSHRNQIVGEESCSDLDSRVWRSSSAACGVAGRGTRLATPASAQADFYAARPSSLSSSTGRRRRSRRQCARRRAPSRQSHSRPADDRAEEHAGRRPYPRRELRVRPGARRTAPRSRRSSRSS